MLTIRAFYSGESLMQITTLKILSHYMRDYRAVKPILLLEEFIVTFFKINNKRNKSVPFF